MDTRALRLEGRFLVRHGPSSEPVFVKVSAASEAAAHHGRKIELERERLCLQVLAGLAVPRLVAFPKRRLPAGFASFRSTHVATAAPPGFGILDAAEIALTDSELCAAWLFVVEQLVAFRRHEILYTDVKCGNVLARKHPFAVRVIDFEHSAYARRGGVLEQYGLTPGFEAPEMAAGEPVTERSIVYQVGLLLVHILVKRSRHQLATDPRHLQRFHARLAKVQATALGPIVKRCLLRQPARRYDGLEQLWRAAAAARLSADVEHLRQELRAPYERRLRGLGL